MADRRIYPDDAADRLKQRAGLPYRPSNGSEGEYFAAIWCSGCSRRHGFAGRGCSIYVASMAHGINEPGYPEEWQYGAEASPDARASATPPCGPASRAAAGPLTCSVGRLPVARSSNPASLPWCDCKVAYGVDDVEKFERWIERTDWCAGLLPSGWHLVETDGAGARMVAIFRVECMRTAEDGRIVYRLLAKHGGYREKRQPRRLPKPAGRLLDGVEHNGMPEVRHG